MSNYQKSFLTKEINSSTFKEQAYDIIKNAILYRQLNVGEVYSQDSICHDLGISRTPVREALIELQKDGYVNFHRGRGISIVELTPKDASDITEMRFFLECINVRLASARISKETLDQMTQNLAEMEKNLNIEDRRILNTIDRDFHRIIAQATGNRYLSASLENIRDLFMRVESQETFQDSVSTSLVLMEHREIFEALCKGNADLADQAMKNHLEHVKKRAFH